MSGCCGCCCGGLIEGGGGGGGAFSCVAKPKGEREGVRE